MKKLLFILSISLISCGKESEIEQIDESKNPQFVSVTVDNNTSQVMTVR